MVMQKKNQPSTKSFNPGANKKTDIVIQLKNENNALKEEVKVLKEQLGRRQYPRKDLKLEVECKTDNNTFYCNSRNISEGGMFLETSKKLISDTELVVKFEILPGNPIQLNGHVVWTFSNGIGIEFDGSKHALMKLKQTLFTIDEIKSLIKER